MRILILLFFFLSPLASKAQDNSLLRSFRSELKNKPRVLLGFDNRRSLVNDAPVKIIGIRYGFDYGKIKLYEGLYSLRDNIVEKRFSSIGPSDTITTTTSFTYLSTTIEYVFHNTRKWEFSVPVQIGIGTGTTTTHKGDSLTDTDKPFFVPAEISANGLYKITPWMGISAGLGYRISLYNTSQFDGSFYNIGLKIFIGKLYRAIKKGP